MRIIQAVALGLATMTAVIVQSAIVRSVGAQTAPGPSAARPTVKLSGGLEATITVVGRNKNGNNISIGMQLENKGKLPIAIALVGPAPFATDNAGATYNYSNFSGAAACSELGAHYVAMCILGEETSGYKHPVPLQAFTQIDPGTTANLAVGLNGTSGTGTLLSFASVFAYRIIADPLKDETMTEIERRKQIRTLNVSFPAFPIQQLQ